MKVNILIHVLDDQDYINDLIRDALTEDIYTIKCFAKADDFLTSFSRDVNLVITDVRVPDYDVLSTIKAIGVINPACYIIVMSAYFDVEIMREFIRLRVDATVIKGPSMDWITELKQEVDRLQPRLIEQAALK